MISSGEVKSTRQSRAAFETGSSKLSLIRFSLASKEVIENVPEEREEKLSSLTVQREADSITSQNRETSFTSLW